MGAIGTALLTQLGATGVNELGKQAGYAIGNLTGYNDAIANDQLEQQKKLTDIQKNANFETMDKSQEMQKDFFEHTFGIQSKYDSAEEQVKRLKEAGLNPALMYSGGNAGGAGGTTGGAQGMAISGGHASDESARKANDMQNQGMALQLAKLASEIEVNKSVAEVNKANAGLSGARTTTEESQRKLVIENLRQQGIEKWLNNELTQFGMTGTESGSIRNSVLNWYTSVGNDSMQFKEMNSALLKTIAETENIEINTKLVNEKVNGYLQELANGTEQANASMINAAANKLQAEFNTGTDVNWKNIGEVLIRLLGVLRR